MKSDLTAIKISLLISNYNYECFIDTAIQSALNQSLPPYEIIVYDDGSTDNSVEIISRFPVSLIKGDHAGVAHARNSLLKEARGTHILFLDGDDWLEPNAIEVVSKKIASDINTEATYSDFRFHKETIHTRTPVMNRSTPSVLSLDTCYRVLHYTPIHSMVFPLSWAIPFDENLTTSEDQAFWSELLLRGGKFAYIDKALAVYRIHNRSRSFARNIESLSNQVDIHGKLIKKYPDALNHRSFMQHVMWRRYKLAIALFSEGRKIEGFRVIRQNIAILRDDMLKRIFVLSLGFVMPGLIIRKIKNHVQGFRQSDLNL
jgi:glycosyltransferase involved in cell wall biosynthesis